MGRVVGVISQVATILLCTGFRRSTKTVSFRPLMSAVKNLIVGPTQDFVRTII